MKYTHPESEKRLGFTLIEVLIVIVIVSLLAAIIFPVLSSARKEASNATCLSNLRQIGIAINLYKHDYDDIYPYACSPEDITNPDKAVLEPVIVPPTPINIVISPYIHNNYCWRCPLDNEGYYTTYGTSYRYDADLFSSPSDLKLLEDPTQVPLAFDASINWHTNNPTFDIQTDYVNVVFTDLHAHRLSWYDATLPFQQSS